MCTTCRSLVPLRRGWWCWSSLCITPKARQRTCEERYKTNPSQSPWKKWCRLNMKGVFVRYHRAFGIQPHGWSSYAFGKSTFFPWEDVLAHILPLPMLLVGKLHLTEFPWLNWFEKGPHINMLLGRQTSPHIQHKSTQVYEANLNSKYRGGMW